MAEPGTYGHGSGESNKRKKDDSPSPAPTSYNSVPPPLTEFELAKQKAQEIAARLLSSADPSKRSRVENGSGGGGFDDYGSHRSSGFSSSGRPQATFASYGASSKKIEIPNSKVGVIIGKGGETIKYLQLQSGAKIQVTRDMDSDPNSVTREVELMGTADQISKAEQLIDDVLAEADAGASGAGSRRMSGPPGTEQFVMKVPNNKVGLVIGKGGETIKSMQASTGARIQVIPLHLPPGDTSRERTVQIDGTSEQIEAARQMVEEVTSENRGRNSGGYSQQGYQARPPPNWGPPGPPPPPSGYGYGQPGPYSAPPPPYNMNQAPYSGYSQGPNSGGYSSGWDQSTNNQQSAHGGGYDYYNQQAPAHGGSGAPTDGSGYGYGQAPPYGQGQGQDGYGYGYGYGYGTNQAGYGQPNSGSGYDQQYPSYGGSSNQSSDGNPSYGAQGETNQAAAPAQSYNAGGPPPASNPSYPSQTSGQPGYGAAPPTSQAGYGTQAASGYGNYGPPQTQKPSGTPPPYSQSQQSPPAPGSYSQGSYPQSQAPPGQQQPAHDTSDPNTQWAPPSSGYQSSQQGYPPPPPYGQPTSQYNSAYSGGYPQSSAYPADASASGNGSSRATPPSQSSQPPPATASAKSSPPN